MSAGLRGEMSTILTGVAFASEITGAASRYGLDPRLLAAVAAQETGGPESNSGRNIVGDGGHGHGLFQIDDRYHPFARTWAAMSPKANADYAARMLSGLLHRYGGNVHRALSAYNAGNPDARGTETTWADGSRLGYADSVLRHYGALGGSFRSLLDEMNAESGTEQINVNALLSFASLQAPATPQSESHSYRRLAGLENDGRSTRYDNTILSEDQ
jgi:Transglycosylase SLT domain